MGDISVSYISMQRHFNTADHLVFVTYPLIKDVKLLLQVVDSLYKSILNLIDAILIYERNYKRIGPYSDNFEQKMQIFRDYCVPRYGFTKEFLDLFKELYNLVEAHKKSPIEFKKDDKYIICNSNYQMKVVTLEQVKSYVINAKPFILKADNILKKDVIR